MLGGNRRRCRSLLQIRSPEGDALRLQLLQTTFRICAPTAPPALNGTTWETCNFIPVAGAWERLLKVGSKPAALPTPLSNVHRKT